MTDFRTSMRAAAVSLLKDYAADRDERLQVYPGRPASINPPTAFIDRIGEQISYLGPTSYQRVPRVDILILHGLFDSKDAVDQADRFVDGFIEWVVPRFHEAGENTLAAITAIEDDPNYVPDWVKPELQRTYFSTLITLEGFAGI